MPYSKPRTASSTAFRALRCGNPLVPITPPASLASRNNKKFSNWELSRPRKQATAMKTPSKTPGSPPDLWELSRLNNMKTGNFLLLAKMQLGTFSLVTKMRLGTFFAQTGNFHPAPFRGADAQPPPVCGRKAQAQRRAGRRGPSGGRTTLTAAPRQCLLTLTGEVQQSRSPLCGRRGCFILELGRSFRPSADRAPTAIINAHDRV